MRAFNARRVLTPQLVVELQGQSVDVVGQRATGLDQSSMLLTGCQSGDHRIDGLAVLAFALPSYHGRTTSISPADSSPL